MLTIKQRYLLINCVNWMATSLTFPIITVFLISTQMVSVVQIGILEIILLASCLFSEVPAGFLADKFSKKNCYLFSILICFFAFLGLLIAHNFTMVVVSYMLWGISQAFHSGGLDAWFINSYELNDQKKDKETSSAFKLLNVINPIAIGSGAIIGLFLSINDYGYRIPIMASLCLLCITFILGLIYIKESNRHSKYYQRRKADLKVLSIIKSINYDYGLILSLSVGYAVIFGFLETFWLMFMLNNGFGKINSGIAYTSAYYISAIFVLYCVKVGLNKEKNWKIILILRTLFLFLFLALGWVNHSYLFFVIIFILLYTTSFIEAPYIQYELNQSINNEYRATLLSIEMTTRRIFSAVGIFLGGYVIEKYNFNVSIISLFLLSSLSTIPFVANVFFSKKYSRGTV